VRRAPSPAARGGRVARALADGRLITIEGIDGAGKSTLAASLADALRERGVAVSLLREPGGVEASERIRELVSDPALDVGARAEALLYAAARAQLVEERVLPVLASGEWVLLDRFVDSSLAYQGAGRELGIEEVAALNRFATGGLRPDRTLLLRVDPAVGQARQAARGATPDRLERAGAEFFARVAAAYEELAAADPGRVRVLDASAPAEALLGAAVAALEDLVVGG
jgi:dTMP kinase